MFVCWLSKGGKCRCVYIWNFPSLSVDTTQHGISHSREWRCDTVFVMMEGMKQDWIKVFLNGRTTQWKLTTKQQNVPWKLGLVRLRLGHRTDTLSSRSIQATPDQQKKALKGRPTDRWESRKIANERKWHLQVTVFFFEKRKKKKNPKTFSYPSKNLFSSLKMETWKFFMRAAAAAAKTENPFFFISTKAKASTSHDKSWVASSLSAGCHDISPEFCCVASASAFFLFLPRSISSIRCDERIEWKACKRWGKKLLERKVGISISFSLSPNRVLDNVTFLFLFRRRLSPFFILIFRETSGWGWDDARGTFEFFSVSAAFDGLGPTGWIAMKLQVWA